MSQRVTGWRATPIGNSTPTAIAQAKAMKSRGRARTSRMNLLRCHRPWCMSLDYPA
jgi:hypothetical protein